MKITKSEITELIRTRIARELKEDPESIPADTPFAELGLDSINSLYLIDELESNFRISFAPTLLWDFPTISSLSDHILERIGK